MRIERLATTGIHQPARVCAAATAAIVCLGVCLTVRPGLAQQPKPTRPSTNAAGAISQFLQALKQAERSLRGNQVSTELPIPPGQRDSDIVIGLENPYIGQVRYGIRVNERFLVTQIVLLNRRKELVSVRASGIRLRVGGKVYRAGEVPPEYRSTTVETEQGTRPLQAVRLASGLTVAPGRAVGGWFLFPHLPLDERIPKMTLEVDVPPKTYRLDVNAFEAERLQLKTELLGPHEAVGLLRIEGRLNTVNTGTLVDHLTELAARRVGRVVISFGKDVPRLETIVRNWLTGMVQRVGRSSGRVTTFGALPVWPEDLGRVAVANMPGPSGSDFATTTPGFYRSEAEALTAVSADLFEYVPTAELRRMTAQVDRRLLGAVLWTLARRAESRDLELYRDLASDPEKAIRWAAIRGLAQFDDPRAVEILLRHARSETDQDARVAALAIADSPHPRFARALLHAVQQGEVRATSPVVLIVAERLRTREWSDVLYRAVSENAKSPPQDALASLIAVGHPRLPELVERLLEQATPLTHRALYSLLRIQKTPEADRLALLVVKHYMRAHPPDADMLNFLTTVHDQEAIDLVLSRLDAELGKTTTNRGQLVALLLRIGDERLNAAIRKSYEKLRPYERGTVLMVMREFDRELFYEYAAAALHDRDRSLVNMAVQALRYDGSDRAVKLLYDALQRELAKVKAGAGRTASSSLTYFISGIASLGDARARRILAEIAPDVPQNVRGYVVTMLRSLRSQSPAAAYLAQVVQAKRERQWDKAELLYRLAEQADAELAEVYLSRAEYWLLRDRLDAAERDFRKAAEIDPHNGHVATGLAIVAVRRGMVEQGVKRLEAALPRYDEDATFLYNAACVYSRACEAALDSGRREAARAYAEKALRLLGDAVRRGFRDLSWAKEDPDLAPLRSFDPDAFRRTVGESPSNDPAPR